MSHSTVKVPPSKKNSFFLVFSSKTQNMGPESQENGFEILKIAPEMPILALQRWHGQKTRFRKVFGFPLISQPPDHLQRCFSTLWRAQIQTKVMVPSKNYFLQILMPKWPKNQKTVLQLHLDLNQWSRPQFFWNFEFEESIGEPIQGKQNFFAMTIFTPSKWQF